MSPRGPRRTRGLVVGLVLAALALTGLDLRQPTALDGVRGALATVLGPAQVVGASVTRPFVRGAQAVRTNADLRRRVRALEAENSRLSTQVNTSGLDHQRLAAYDGLTRTAADTGYTIVPAHVVGIGPAANFSRVVTIDAGRRAGVAANSTVVTDRGLVGRVLRVSDSTASVLLACDAASVVGGRLTSSLKVGLVRGDGGLGDRARLRLDLVDTSVTPGRGDVVVTWGSERGGPYVAGIPIGTVDSVRISARDSRKQAVLMPAVDFAALDLVGVVVAKGTRTDRGLITPSGVQQ